MEPTSFHDGRVRLYRGDCREALRELPDCSVDSVVTDPPYALTMMKRLGGSHVADVEKNFTKTIAGQSANPFQAAARGFMGKRWDTGETAFAPEFWRDVARVLRPGGHVLAFGGTRSGHRLAVAIEDAGFEIRDCLGWITGSGFPKFLNASVALRRSLPADVQCVCGLDCLQTVQDSQSDCQSYRDSGDERPQQGRDNDPAAVPSLADVRERTHACLREDGQGREQANSDLGEATARPSSAGSQRLSLRQQEDCPVTDSARCDTPLSTLSGAETVGHRSQLRKQDISYSGGGSAAFSSASQSTRHPNLPHCSLCGKIKIPDGLGTALKPAWEMIYLARKPLSEKTIAANVLRWGTGALNIDGCRVGTESPRPSRESRHDPLLDATRTTYGAGLSGSRAVEDTTLSRWPANVIHDGSDEVVGAFPQTSAGCASERHNGEFKSVAKGRELPHSTFGHSDNGGSAARFFYTAKADADDRLGSKHPTVKPLDLKQYLVRLITPKGGTVLDMFAGSGTTAEAALREGMRCILCEREPEYQADIERRMKHVFDGELGRSVAIAKARPQKGEPMTLFPEATS